jgi:colanic acid biosynthesis glycosyl transferase WcaI
VHKDYPDLLFLLVGEGSAKELLVERAYKLGLRNVVFKPPQPPEDLPALLALGDVHLVIQKRGAGDAVMPSKLTGILAAGGTAIITADAETELGRLVIDNPGIAVLVPPENRARLQEALLAALKNKGESPGINLVARKYAERYLAADVVLSQLDRMLTVAC